MTNAPPSGLHSLRGHLERFVSRRLLRNSFSLADGSVARLWRMYFWLAAVVGVLGLLFERSTKVVLEYGAFAFTTLSLSIFRSGRDWPGTLLIAALADSARLVGLLPASPHRTPKPSIYLHCLFVLGGVAGLLFLAVAMSPAFFYALTGRRIHAYVTDVPLTFRVAWFTVILLHLAVTSFCLAWCQGAGGRAVYALLCLPGLAVAVHLPMLTFEQDYARKYTPFLEVGYAREYTPFLEVGFLGLCSIIAARLYWRGWRIRRLKPDELLDCLRPEQVISENPSPDVSRTEPCGPKPQKPCGDSPPENNVQPPAPSNS